MAALPPRAGFVTFTRISADLGGVAMLSEGQRQLIRRAAMLSAECERQEAMSASSFLCHPSKEEMIG